MQIYKSITTKIYFSLSILSLLLFSCAPKSRVDLILHHAVIYTVDSSFSIAEAMAIQDGKIVAIGKNDSILKNFSSDSILDVKGKAVYPGFIDAHCHFTGYATDSWKCHLVGTTSFEEIINKIIEYSKTAPMQWIYGHGWDQNDWEDKFFPNKKRLDSLFPDRPVFLKRIDGHAALANQKAIDIAGINLSTIVTGGSIEKVNGKLTGMFIDNAMDVVEKNIPTISDSLAKKYFLKLHQEFL